MELFAPLHILVILFVFILLFGPKKLPEMGRALGEGIREFKKSMKEISNNGEASKTILKPSTLESEPPKQ